MSETATLEAPAQAPVETAPAPAAPVVAPVQAPVVDATTFDRDIGTVAPDVLSKLMPKPAGIKSSRTQAQAPVAVPVEVPAATAAPEPVASAPELVAPEPPAEDPKLAKNWRMSAKDAKEAMVFAAMKAGATMQEAYAEVFGEAPKTATPSTPEPISPPVPEVDPVAEADKMISGIASQVAELESQIDKLAEDGDNKTALKLIRQQSDLKLKLEQSKTARDSMMQDAQNREVQTAVQRHRQLEQQSLEKMYEAYPKLTDKVSEERAQFNLKVAELEKDPSFGPRFRETMPGWPLMVSRMVDAEKGWSRATPPAAPAPAAKAPTMNPLTPKQIVPPAPVAPVRATSAEVISPSTNHGSPTVVANAQTFWKDSENVTPDVLIKLMGKAPVDPRLLQKRSNDPRRFAGR